jgi:hypothetical protein
MKDEGAWHRVWIGIAIGLSVPGLVFMLLAGAVAIVLLAPTVAIALALDEGDQ